MTHAIRTVVARIATMDEIRVILREEGWDERQSMLLHHRETARKHLCELLDAYFGHTS